MITRGQIDVALRVQHIDDGAGADLITGLIGFQRAAGGYAGLVERLDLADGGFLTAIGVADGADGIALQVLQTLPGGFIAVRRLAGL
jgi:hypothetical protein